MKTVTFITLSTCSYVVSALSIIWTNVEFILYLVKDKEFNWWSVWLIPIGFFAAVLFAAIGAAMAAKQKHEERQVFKSSFQKRMEELKKKN